MKGLEGRLNEALRPVRAPGGLTDAVMARVAAAGGAAAEGAAHAGGAAARRAVVPWWRLTITPATGAACLGLALMGVFISVAEAAAGGTTTPVPGHLAQEMTGVGTTLQLWIVNLQLHVMQIITRLSGV